MADQWFYGREGQQNGPVAFGQLRQLAIGRQLRPDDVVWKEGWSEWRKAADVAGLFTGPTPPNSSSPFTLSWLTGLSTAGKVDRTFGVFAWVRDVPLLFTSPGRFYERRATEGTLYPALSFCIGYTFMVSLVSLLVMISRVGTEYTPLRLLIYAPLFWTAVVAVRGALLGLIIAAKAGSPMARSLKQGFTVDAFSWVSFFTFLLFFWPFMTLCIFSDAEPITVGPYIIVALIVCRLHGCFLDLRGLNAMSGIGWAVAGIIVMVIDAASSLIIGVVGGLMLYNLFSNLFSNVVF